MRQNSRGRGGGRATLGTAEPQPEPSGSAAGYLTCRHSEAGPGAATPSAPTTMQVATPRVTTPGGLLALSMQGAEHGDGVPPTRQNAVAHSAPSQGSHAGGGGPRAKPSHRSWDTTAVWGSVTDLAATQCTVRVDTPLELVFPVLHGAEHSDQLDATWESRDSLRVRLHRPQAPAPLGPWPLKRALHAVEGLGNRVFLTLTCHEYTIGGPGDMDGDGVGRADPEAVADAVPEALAVWVAVAVIEPDAVVDEVPVTLALVDCDIVVDRETVVEREGVAEPEVEGDGVRLGVVLGFATHTPGDVVDPT